MNDRVLQNTDTKYRYKKSHAFGISEYDSSTQQTFSLDCGGAAGDMIYITDTKFDDDNKHGHGIAEVRVFEAGRP